MDLSIDDFRQYYEYTFAKYDGQICKIEDVYMDGRIELIFKPVQHPQIVKFQHDFDKFDFTFPPSGYFNFDNKALILFRTITRQWRRGLCPGTAWICNPLRIFTNTPITRGVPLTFPVVHAIYNRQYPSVKDAIDLLTLKTPKISVAVSPKMAISLSPNVKYPFILWYRVYPVGYINTKSNVVVEEDTFYQEVKDEFNRIGASEWIQ